ncbi:DUF4149 domain-containing protein [Helicobacter sp. MIT 21-1697]|uniref:DUF4149 domain-containing protein n=1 Tax=Helicobacter sp. MIT 21-1697 TaxID=2993733 RepID=UPI00224ABC0F|nr:DUF4149 domain-containing protein [Helicobacter sp. MIT 21-1697]MCX2716745.1 DUF4149 domain-containing protein [Helicobacter sp. MIT 21-1697]
MNLPKIFRVFDSIYILLLGSGVGVIIACVFAAATIFKAQGFLPQLSISDSGLLMGTIFTKCNVFFNILAGVIIIYELLTFWSAQLFELSNQRRFWTLIGGINVIMIFLFTLYYTPYIMEAQNLGNIATPEFDSMHKQSELVFKILLVGLSVSALWRGFIGSTPIAPHSKA